MEASEPKSKSEYICGSCGKVIQLAKDEPVRCPFCGRKILFKERQKVIKKIKAI